MRSFNNFINNRIGGKEALPAYLIRFWVENFGKSVSELRHRPLSRVTRNFHKTVKARFR